MFSVYIIDYMFSVNSNLLNVKPVTRYKQQIMCMALAVNQMQAYVINNVFSTGVTLPSVTNCQPVGQIPVANLCFLACNN